MPDASSAERAAAALPGRRAFDVAAGARAAMVALGTIPFLHLVASLAPVALVVSGLAGTRVLILTPVLLYLLPPIVVRAAIAWRPFTTGRIEPGSPAFLQWWHTAQWQIVFNRFPLLEEAIRMVPGVYSAWLRLWGADIGSLVYWAPGVVILDRPLVRVGDRVIFGMGVRLNPHALAPDDRGRITLALAPVTIGRDALIGGYSLLLPGCRVDDGAITPPLRSLHAFSHWPGERRRSSTAAAAAEAPR
jgi:hypothetical protein